MQRVKWLILPLLFVLLIDSSLYAKSFKDIIFQPATAKFQLEEKKEDQVSQEIYVSSSNYVKVKTKELEDQNITKEKDPTITFYRYDTSSDSYLTVSQTFYQPNEEIFDKFNPMTPLVLQSGEEIDISKKIPAIKCQIFRKNEPLIIIYQDSDISDRKSVELDITTDKDRERIELYRSDENSSIYIGYINTKTECLAKFDGFLFVEKGTEIKASLVRDVTKSRSFEKEIFAIAGVEHIVLQTKSDDEQKESKVWVSIESNKRVASVGEYIKFDVTIDNRGNKDIFNAVILSTLSKGLKYKLGNSKKEMKVLKAGESITIPFVTIVDIDAKDVVEDSVTLHFDGKISNRSVSQVKIEREFDDKSTIFGKVQLDDKDRNISLSGIKLYLEDGRYTLSDRYGKFHFQDITPATHVVSIDPETLKGRFTLTECKVDTRNLRSKTSYFVDTRSSHIKRVKFCIKENRLLKDINSTLSFKMSDKKSDGMPEFDLDAFEKYKDGFLWPKEGYVPPMPSIKVAFMHKNYEKMVLYLNGKKVDMLNYDGSIKSRDKKRVISKYRGIDIVDGDNILEAKIGNRVIKRKIHLSTTPVKAVILKDRSTLIADGKNPIVVAVKLFDAAGYPLRKGMVGKFRVEKPYISNDRLDQLNKNPLALGIDDDKYVVSESGIAYITLQPTSKSGELKLHFPFQNSNEYLKTWISPKARDWFIVGFAEGSIGYQTIKDELKKERLDEVITDKKISFFAKGKISADTLMTIAYDSGKRSDLGILEEVDLKSEYTVYADSTIQRNEAPSSKKLYIKIEKNTFYTLFGDFDTSLDSHQLSRYSRRLNGLKSEFKGEIFEYSAFISKSSSSFQREEIIPDGTSGFYQLSTRDIIFGSERVYLEVRDRYQDEKVISKKVLNRVYDYNIDYKNSTLYFKEPIQKRDRYSNPRFIVVEYEIENGSKESYIYGGRGAIKLFDGILELGSTLIKEDDLKSGTLYGFDAKLKATDNLIINAEYAKTNKDDSNSSTQSGYLMEISHHNQYTKTNLYYKKQEDGFGFSQQSFSQSATQKYGVDTTINYFRYMALKLSAYSDKSLKSGDSKSALEAVAQYQKSGYIASLGYKLTKESQQSNSNSQILTTISKAFFDSKLKLSAAYDFSLAGKSDQFYDRAFAEASYFINQYVEIFANHEILDGLTKKLNLSRAGIRSRPWSGATIESSITEEFENDSPRIFGEIGVHQNWQINKKVMLSASVEREQRLNSGIKDDEFTSYSLGANYRDNDWVYSARGEYKTSIKERKTNLDFGIYTEINEGLGLAFGTRINDKKTEDNSFKDAEIKFSLAKRDDNYLLVNRLKFLYNKEQNTKVSKAVNSLIFEIYPMKNTTLSAHYGIKYIRDQIDDNSYSSFVDTAGYELVYDLNRRLELGFIGSFLHSYETKSIDQSLGAYIGYNIFKNGWLGLGYNFSGFKDDDFRSLRRSEQGAYLKFRLKFDQESLEEITKLYK